MVEIREARIDDAEKKGYVHYKTWQETYTGLIDQEYMDKLTVEKCVDFARRYLYNTLLAVEDNEIVGFACYGKCRDEEKEDYGEIMALYILKSHQRKGIGKMLMGECQKKLPGCKKFCVWVLKSNINAIKFYEKQGFVFSGKEKEIVLGSPVKVIRMDKEV